MSIMQYNHVTQVLTKFELIFPKRERMKDEIFIRYILQLQRKYYMHNIEEYKQI